MDLSATVSPFENVKKIFKKDWNSLTLITPFVWLCTYIPFGIFITTATWVTLTNQIEGRIHCSIVDGFSQSYANSYCLRQAYSILDGTEKPRSRTVYPGVGPYRRGDAFVSRGNLWNLVPVLTALGVVFIIPAKMWKYSFQGNMVGEVVSYMVPQTQVRAEDYFKDELRRHRDLVTTLRVFLPRCGWFTFTFLTCDLMVPICGLIVHNFLLQFLGPFYESYGLDVLIDPYVYSLETRVQDYLFPTVVTCQVLKIGPSGSLMNLDTICYIPSCAVYQTAFVIIWFAVGIQFYLSLFTFCVGNIIWCMPHFRRWYLTRQVPPGFKEMAIKLEAKLTIAKFMYVRLILRNLPKAFIVKLLPLLEEALDDM